MTKINIPYDISVSINAVINVAKVHWSKYHAMQKTIVNTIALILKSQHIKPVETYPVHITTKYYCKSKRRDPDNICASKKFLLDALVLDGVIQGDGWKYITGFKDEFYLDRANPRIEIIIH